MPRSRIIGFLHPCLSARPAGGLVWHHLIKPLFKKKWLLQPVVRQIEGDSVIVPFLCTSTVHRGEPSSRLMKSSSRHPHGQHIATLQGSPSSVIRYTLPLRGSSGAESTISISSA